MNHALLLAASPAPVASNNGWTCLGIAVLGGIVAFLLLRIAARARRERVWP